MSPRIPDNWDETKWEIAGIAAGESAGISLREIFAPSARKHGGLSKEDPTFLLVRYLRPREPATLLIIMI